MKKTFLILLLLICAWNSNAQTKVYMTFQAEIANKFGDAIYISDSNNKLIKKIKINKEGIFKDTLKVETGRYSFSDGNEFTVVYLKNGFDLKMKLDTKMFDESIVYSGKGAVENNFLAKNSLYEEQTDIGSLLISPEADFYKGLDTKKADDLARLENKKLDPVFVVLQKNSIEDNYKAIIQYYKKNYEANLAKSKMNNTVSPSFEYENHKGGTTKLEDLRGKYVYIDVWATWCGPCRGEIPSLKKVEEKYQGKNIEFVSISVDVDKDHDKWEKFVTEKKLGGMQLFADKNWLSDFIRSYEINSIPRFILIDPDGKVIKSDAARPSNPELQKQLDALLN